MTLSDQDRGAAEEVARLVHQVVVDGGDLEAVIRRLLTLAPAPVLLIEASRWSHNRHGQGGDDAWELVAADLSAAHDLGIFGH